jgi:hypothetical protein
LRNRGILGLDYPFRRTGGKTFILVRHLVLSSLSFWVLKLLRQSPRFLCSEVSVSWIGQKLGQITALPVLIKDR